MRVLFRLGSALLLAISFVAGSGGVRAQEDPPAIITYFEAEVVFPTAVRFRIRLEAVPEDIASASLTLTQEDVVLREGPLDLEAMQVEDSLPYVDWLYDWPIALDEPPMLFTPILIQLAITDVAENLYELEEEIGFVQPVGEEEDEAWRQAGEPPLRLTLFEPLNTRLALQAAQATYDLMVDLTGQEPDFNWLILPLRYTFCREVENEAGELERVTLTSDGESLPCGEADAERIYRAHGYRLWYRQSPGLLPFENELIADMFAEFFSTYWQDVDVPDWFFSGLEQLFYVTPNPLALRLTQDTARAEQLFSAEQLAQTPQDAEALASWQQQAYTLVLYLAERYGADAPFTLAEDLLDEEFAAAISALTGEPFAATLVNWERWLFTDDAEAAASWTIYTPATATPTATRTDTPFPPTPTATRTATVTDTPTLTPTATSQVFQVPSPLPSFTPTQAVIPTASNTPRPPGSLDQPPAGDSGGGQGGGGICPAALPALLLPVGAVLFVNRRKPR